MVDKVNGKVSAGEFLGRNLDFFVFTGPVNILTSSTTGGNAATTGNAVTQAALDKLVEVVSLRGQPVIMGAPFFDAAAGPGLYTVKFATEHNGAWTGADLKTAAVANAPAYMAANASLITVTLATTL